MTFLSEITKSLEGIGNNNFKNNYYEKPVGGIKK